MARDVEYEWRNAPTLYLARALRGISDGSRAISVLDVGCGDGATMAQLGEAGFDVYGYDLSGRDDEYADSRRMNLAGLLESEYTDRVKVTDSEREIPFDSRMFDVAYANQVFEHVRFLDPMLAECARVLKPNGMLLALFPLATSPIEAHLLVPFAHWLPPGGLRIKYLTLASRLGILRSHQRTNRLAPSQNGRAWDAYLRDNTYYRFINEVTRVALHHFETVDVDTRQLVSAKIDLMSAGQNRRAAMLAGFVRWLDAEGDISSVVTYLFNAVLRISNPR